MSTSRASDTPPAVDPAVRALAREVGQLAAGVAQLTAKAGRAEETATAAANAVTTLSRAVQDLYDRGGRDAGDQADDDGGSGTGPTPPWWHVDNPEQARAILADLVDWMADVYGRHPDAAGLSGCWPLHPDVVTELVALHDGWQAAYYGKFASPAAVLDWLDRWRPNTVKRVNAALSKCRIEKHESGGEWIEPTRPGGELVDDVATWWAAGQGATAPPSPSPAAVKAEQDRRALRNRY